MSRRPRTGLFDFVSPNGLFFFISECEDTKNSGVSNSQDYSCSALQQPECKGPAPRNRSDLFDHRNRPPRYVKESSQDFIYRPKSSIRIIGAEGALALQNQIASLPIPVSFSFFLKWCQELPGRKYDL